MKKKILVGILIAALLIVGAAAVWWFLPAHFLNGADPADIAAIEVFNGNDGNRFSITDEKDISYLFENIRKVPMKKEQIAMGMGTTYNLRFLDSAGKEIDRFIIMSRDTIRSGMMFYTCNGELQPVEEYLMNLERAQFPDTDWLKGQPAQKD